MKYIDKEMSKIDFYGIKYRKIKDVNDYSLLKSEIDHLLKEGDKKQYLISAENSKIKAEYEKDKSMNINLSLAQSLLFCICGYICGYLGGGKTYEILEFIKGFIICFALAFFIGVLSCISYKLAIIIFGIYVPGYNASDFIYAQF